MKAYKAHAHPSTQAQWNPKEAISLNSGHRISGDVVDGTESLHRQLQVFSEPRVTSNTSWQMPTSSTCFFLFWNNQANIGSPRILTRQNHNGNPTLTVMHHRELQRQGFWFGAHRYKGEFMYFFTLQNFRRWLVLLHVFFCEKESIARQNLKIYRVGVDDLLKKWCHMFCI